MLRENNTKFRDPIWAVYIDAVSIFQIKIVTKLKKSEINI